MDDNDKILSAIEEAHDYLDRIRFHHWPSKGLGIGLVPNDMDQILKELRQAMLIARRRVKKARYAPSDWGRKNDGRLR